MAQLRAYLVKAGVDADALQLGALRHHEVTRRVILDRLGNDRQERTGFRVQQTVSLKGYEDLDLVQKLAKQIGSDLSRTGLPISPVDPYIYFSKDVTDLKPALLRQAAENAYQRASIVAESSGSKLGGLRAARQGAFEGLGGDGHVGGLTRTHRIRAIVTVDYAVGGCGGLDGSAPRQICSRRHHVGHEVWTTRPARPPAALAQPPRLPNGGGPRRGGPRVHLRPLRVRRRHVRQPAVQGAARRGLGRRHRHRGVRAQRRRLGHGRLPVRRQ